MLVRSSFKCLTCGQAHIVRIGMGQEARQVHRFPCHDCGEDMVVALCVDYEKISHWVEEVENAELIKEVTGAPIINVDANFIVPIHQRHSDFIFPRMENVRQRFNVAVENGSISDANVEELGRGKWNERPFRRPDFEEEWKLLKTTWSLHRRGRQHLVADRLKSASETYYTSDPLASIQDWLWRFTMFFSQPAYEKPFKATLDRLLPLLKSKELGRFREHYNKISDERADRYLEVFRSYFESYDQFAQVHFDVVRGIEIPDGNMASSVDFGSVKMFYGNTFEALSSSIDILAYFANINAGRQFDEFQNLKLKDYLRLDKPGRFGPLAAVPEFDELCSERDNQLRNASHHGGTRLDLQTQMITFQSGKGGQGETKQISYGKYLEKCDKIFLQMVVLLRLEILLCQAAPGLKWPI